MKMCIALYLMTKVIIILYEILLIKISHLNVVVVCDDSSHMLRTNVELLHQRKRNVNIYLLTI